MFTGRTVSHLIKNAIAALGPFWGAFHLPATKKARALRLQSMLFGVTVDDHLSNTHAMLHRYFGEA